MLYQRLDINNSRSCNKPWTKIGILEHDARLIWRCIPPEARRSPPVLSVGSAVPFPALHFSGGSSGPRLRLSDQL